MAVFDLPASVPPGALAAATTRVHARREGIDEIFERREIVEAVHEAMQSLSEPFREASLLVDFHDHTYASAAQILGVPVGTVRSRLFRARRLLQQQLIKHARDLGLAPATSTASAGESA